MFNKDDFVVYKCDVCKVLDLKKINNRDYYVLEPVDDSSLKINVPIDNACIRNLITLDGIKKLISEIPNIDAVDVDNKNIDNIYKSLIEDGSYQSLVKVIKTAFLINKERVNHNKKIRDKDEHYFKKAEELLYNEFSIVLNKSFDDTKQYVISEVEKLI